MPTWKEYENLAEDIDEYIEQEKNKNQDGQRKKTKNKK